MVMPREASVRPEHIDGRWLACIKRRVKSYFVAESMTALGWFDELIVYS